MIDTYSLAHKKLLDENYLWITTFILLSPPLMAEDYSVLHNIVAKKDFDLFVGIFLVRIYCATFFACFSGLSFVFFRCKVSAKAQRISGLFKET